MIKAICKAIAGFCIVKEAMFWLIPLKRERPTYNINSPLVLVPRPVVSKFNDSLCFVVSSASGYLLDCFVSSGGE